MPKITIEVARGESDRDYVITAIDSNGNTRIRQFAGNERDATHRAFGMSVVFGALYDQLRYIVDEKFDTLKHIGQHPAERRADELTAQLATATSEATRLARELVVAQQERDTARAERDVAWTELRGRFERTAPLDWRTDDETSLGQMLDGMGDEVE